MRLLVLGGTVFVGRHVVAAALAAGHEVAMFNRGREDDRSFPDAERLVGDRSGDLAALRGRQWDGVIDVAAYVPSFVERAAGVLAGACAHYTFVSTRSVYADLLRTTEADAVSEIDDDDVAAAEARAVEGRADATQYGPHYGALKVRCERAAARAFGDRLLVVRPGLIVGPHDPTDRFTYWVRRVARGGDVLAPGRPDRVIRFIDGRDLAAWIIRSIERRLTGTFNAGGAGTTMQAMLDACREAAGSDARFRWAEEAFLLARGVAPWNELPLWIPEDRNGFLEVADDRAMREGLVYRPLEATTADTLAWDRTRVLGPMETGLTEAREAELLAELTAARAG